jgi:lipid A 3-O-deacylase PagL
MKKILVTTVVLLSVLLVHAQYGDDREFKPFKVDVSAGPAIPQGSGSKFGLVFVIEPKYAIVDQFAVGLRIEEAVMARAFPNGDGTYSSANVSGAASYLATGDYYFTNETFRPFVGAGAGIYGLASASVDDNGYETAVASASKFGAMIRAGFEAAHFRLGIEYNIIGNSTAQTFDNNGNVVTSVAKNSYLGIKFGVCIGGGRYK